MALFACKAMAVSSSSQSSCIINSTTAASQLTATRSHAGAALSGLKNAGMVQGAAKSSLLLPSLRGTPLRSGDIEHKGSWLMTERRPSGVAVVRASTIGVVKEVKRVSKEPLYYNVALTVSPTSEVAKWYTTPGQYVNLILVESQHSSASAFFIASPVRKQATELEFLIQDVPNTVANEIINSKPGDRVSITTDPCSTGFNLSELNPIEESQSVLMFASGYGLGSIRALIETGFEANKRKNAILYAMYTPEQVPYVDRFVAWERTGVQVQQGPLNNIIETDPANTVVLMVASVDEQEKLATYFEGKGVSEDKILTLFSGIPTSEKSYYNKVLYKLQYYPKFPHHAEKHLPVELKI